MIKRLSSGILILLLAVVLFTNVAFATPGTNSDYKAVVNAVERLNDNIVVKVENAQDAADAVIAIYGESEVAVELVDVIITELIEETNAMVDKVIRFADLHDIIVSCELQAYEVGGQVVIIDPLFIMSD